MEARTEATHERNTEGLNKGGRPKLSPEDKKQNLTLNMHPGDRAVLEALAEYWSTSMSEAVRTMLRHFEATLKIDVRRR